MNIIFNVKNILTTEYKSLTFFNDILIRLKYP